MHKISAIIVSYNTKPLLIQCIENFLSFSLKKFDLEIIVVDNASPDNSADAVYSKFGNKIKLIRSQNNGLAAGSNLGLARATGDILLYIGTDAYPTEEALIEMLKFFDVNPDAGILTPKLVTRDGKIDMDAHRGFPTPWSAITNFTKLNKVFPHSPIFNQYFLGYKDFSKSHEIDVCITHFMLVQRQVHNIVGLWDEDYFLYGEDVDFCYRAKQCGFKIYYLSNTSVLHYKGASVGRKQSADVQNKSTKSPKNKIRMIKESTKAMELFYKKHYTNTYPKVLTLLVLFAIRGLTLLRILFFRLNSFLLQTV